MEKVPTVMGEVNVWRLPDQDGLISYLLQPLVPERNRMRVLICDGRDPNYTLRLHEILEIDEHGTVDAGDVTVMIDFECDGSDVEKVMDRLVIDISRGAVSFIDDPAVYGMAVDRLLGRVIDESYAE